MQSIPQIKVRGRRLTWGKQVSDLAIVRSVSYSPRCSDDPESLGGKFSPCSRTMGFDVQQPVTEDENEDDSAYSVSSSASVIDGFQTGRLHQESGMDTLDPFFAERDNFFDEDEESFFVAKKRSLCYRRTESEEQVPQIPPAPLSSGREEDRPSSDDYPDDIASFYTFTTPLSSDDLAGMGLSREATNPSLADTICEKSDLSRDDEWVVLGDVSKARPKNAAKRSKSFTCSPVSKSLENELPPQKRKSCYGNEWDAECI